MVTWGILSTARIGLNAVAPAILAVPQARLAAVASQTPGKAEEYLSALSKNTGRQLDDVKAYDSYEALLDDPDIDAVYIPLPNGMHAEWTIRAAKAKKHVLCEKPMAVDAGQARYTIDFCKNEGIIFMEAFMYQFHPQYQRIREILAAGRIGDVRLIRSAFSFPLPNRQDIRYSKELAGGSLMDVGCYCIHSARLLYGEEPVSVAASGVLENDVDSAMTAILNFPRGRKALFDVSFTAARRQVMEIVGTEGVILVERPWKSEGVETRLLIGSGLDEQGWSGLEAETMPAVSTYQLEVEAFCDAVEGRRPLPVDPEGSYRNMLVIDAVRKAARTKETLCLNC
jgi:xylose dehydrogenase (NAD/NADP)